MLGLVTLLCLAGSITMIVEPNEAAPVLAPLLGVLFTVVCAWLLHKSLRLIIGSKNKGASMSPRTLRAIAWLFLSLPIGAVFTGYLWEHTLMAVVQTAAYISIFFGLRRLAADRESELPFAIDSVSDEHHRI